MNLIHTAIRFNSGVLYKLVEFVQEKLSLNENQKFQLMNTHTKFLKKSPLHFVSKFDCSGEIFGCLLNSIPIQDSSLEAKDHKGQTPLHQASKRGNIEIAKTLLEVGARLDDPSIMKSARSPRMVGLLMDHNPELAFKRKSSNHEGHQSAFEKFIKHSPSSAITILDKAIGSNNFDPDSSEFLITMDLGYFHEIMKRYGVKFSSTNCMRIFAC